MRIPKEILTEIYRHARSEFPNECCGWLTGPKGGDKAVSVRRATNAYEPDSHPTAHDRTAETAYVIDGTDLLELNRSLDSPAPSRVAYQFPATAVVVRPAHEPPRVIYHSHPNGRAYFSETDRRVATDPWGDGPAYPVKQLVVGIDANRVVEARLFEWDDSVKGFTAVSEFPGAEV